MRRYTVCLQLIWLLAIFGWRSADAQIQFTNSTATNSQTDFTANGATTTSGSIPINPSNGYSFTVTVYRSVNTANQGYVSIWSGVSSPTKQLTTTTSGSYSTDFGTWYNNGMIESKLLSGSFSSGSIDAGHQKLYAVFTNTGTGVKVNSAPIAIVAGTQSSGGGTGGTTAVQVSCLPYNTAPFQLKATYAVESRNDLQQYSGNYRMVWKRSSDGSNYTTVFTSKDSYYYSPPALYAKTYFYGQLEHDIGNFGISNWKATDDPVASYIYEIQGFVPYGRAPNITSCGSNISLSVQNMPNAPYGQYTINWTAPSGWKINGQGSSLTEPSGNVTLTPPTGLPQGSTYQIRVSSNGTCGSKSAEGIITVTMDYTPTPAPTTGSFYITRYQGCQKFYGITMEAVDNPTRYQYTASVTGDGVGGSTVGEYDASTNRVTFPLDIQAPYGGATATATITVTGLCNPSQSISFTEYLSGIDPGCGGSGDPGQTQDMTTTSYPNPANESLTVPKGVEEATLFDGRGRPVQKAGKLGKVNVRDLPEGLYNLRMIRQGKIINQRIQVKH